jgi:hypothetical protein
MEARAQRYRELVRHAVAELHAEGTYPSQQLVRQRLPKDADMREPAVYGEWKRALGELYPEDREAAAAA